MLGFSRGEQDRTGAPTKSCQLHVVDLDGPINSPALPLGTQADSKDGAAEAPPPGNDGKVAFEAPPRLVTGPASPVQLPDLVEESCQADGLTCLRDQVGAIDGRRQLRPLRQRQGNHPRDTVMPLEDLDLESTGFGADAERRGIHGVILMGIR